VVKLDPLFPNSSFAPLFGECSLSKAHSPVRPPRPRDPPPYAKKAETNKMLKTKKTLKMEKCSHRLKLKLNAFETEETFKTNKMLKK